ncbi:T9SS type A sorting domain-containing protein [Hymenobacter sp. HSC-4F20]|nr:T9SS type A sorting domain-containing protein [Hymenobacter sp. HSC-4F20]
MLPLLALLSCVAGSAQAQYVFRDKPTATSNGLAPYVQNFDGLSGTNKVFSNNVTLPGVYAGFTLNKFGPQEFPTSIRTNAAGLTYYDRTIPPDNGSQGNTVNPDGTAAGAGWYHFGSTTTNTSDRALGGIAATSTDTGVGYIGIRLQNASGTLIKNLEVAYAMEQWYNSGKVDDAKVRVWYRKLPASATTASKEALVSGTWTEIPDLFVPAPSTAAVIASSDGNSATNRRVARAKLLGDGSSPFGAGLADGEEIMIRWSYVFNSTSNGNGLSLDDVTITPETNIFYSAATGSLSDKGTWGVNTDGSGTSPNNFNLDNTTFYVRGNTPGVSRLSSGAPLNIKGTNTKLVVGRPGEPATLYLGSNDNLAATVDVTAGSTLQIDKLASGIVLGALATTSTVEYSNSATTGSQVVAGGSYGNLKLTGTGPKHLGGNVLISNKVSFASAGLSALTLKDFDVTVLKEATIDMQAGSGLFVTDGKGGLRQTVTSAGTEVTFPVAVTPSLTDYTPVVLSQTAANSEDTYKVRVANNVFRSYDANENGTDPITAGVVKKTWFVSEEVPGNSDITLQAFWTAKDEATGFQASNAFIDHYTTGATWDGVRETQALMIKGSMKGSKKGSIKKFSPFGVTSQSRGVLPVQLTAFTATRSATGVECNWQTATELHNDRFVVERSATGQHFSPIGTVAGHGTTTTSQRYRFLDTAPLAGVSYYRLRQVDTDGTSSESAVAVVTTAVASGQVLPNPGTTRFQVLLPATTAVLEGEVFSLLGARVATLAPDRTFELTRHPAGVYLLRIRTDQGTQSIRVVKE